MITVIIILENRSNILTSDSDDLKYHNSPSPMFIYHKIVYFWNITLGEISPITPSLTHHLSISSIANFNSNIKLVFYINSLISLAMFVFTCFTHNMFHFYVTLGKFTQSYHTTHSVRLDSLLTNLLLVDGRCNSNGRRNGNRTATVAMDSVTALAMERAKAMRQQWQWKAQWQRGSSNGDGRRQCDRDYGNGWRDKHNNQLSLGT